MHRKFGNTFIDILLFNCDRIAISSRPTKNRAIEYIFHLLLWRWRVSSSDDCFIRWIYRLCFHVHGPMFIFAMCQQNGKRFRTIYLQTEIHCRTFVVLLLFLGWTNARRVLFFYSTISINLWDKFALFISNIEYVMYRFIGSNFFGHQKS